MRDPEKAKAYAKEVREWRKAHHMCTRCGHEKADPGKSTCLQCRMARREYARGYDAQPKVREEVAARRAYKKANGICYACSKPVYKDHAYCYEHYLAQKRQLKAWHDKYNPRKNYPATQCRICGAPVTKKPDGTVSRFCEEHYEQYVKLMNKANEVRLENEESKNRWKNL